MHEGHRIRAVPSRRAFIKVPVSGTDYCIKNHPKT